MRKNVFKTMELSGILFCMAAVSVLRTLYEVFPGSTVGILFGSVNNSVWEQLKPMILCCILYGFTELMCAMPYFRRFVSAKALGLYSSVLFYIIIKTFLPSEFDAVLTLVSICLGFIISKNLTLCKKDISFLFYPACFMLLLIFIMYFSFTPFPPKINLFLDRESGMYGIIPDYIDKGAQALNLS